MNNNNNFNPVTLIIGIVIGIIGGIAIGAVAVGKIFIKKLKAIVAKLRAEYRNDLESTQQQATTIIEAKDTENKKLLQIIDDLLNLFHEKDEKGRSIIDSKIGRASYNQIVKQRSRLN